jgi:hypothetical protein
MCDFTELDQWYSFAKSMPGLTKEPRSIDKLSASRTLETISEGLSGSSIIGWPDILKVSRFPFDVVNTGAPQANASKTGKPKPSYNEGKIKSLAFLYKGAIYLSSS